MQLPVSDIITAACRDTWQGRRDFVAFAFLPVLMLSIIGTLMVAVVGNPQIVITDQSLAPPQITGPQFVASMIMLLVSFIFYTLFAVAWHRRTLVGREATTIGAAMRWGRRQWHFLRRIVLLMVDLFALMIFLTAILSIALKGVFPIVPVLIAIVIALGLIYARTALVLPAATTDLPMTFIESARLTQGNSWRMLVAIVLLPIGVMLAGRFAVLVFAAALGGLTGPSVTAQFLVTLLAQSVNYAAFAVGITALSLAYRELTA